MLLLRWLLLVAAVAVACGALLRAMPRRPTPDDGPWRRALGRLRADRGALAALWALLLVAALAAAAPLVSPYDPIAQPDLVALKSLPPSLAHPFGTDQSSRDVLSRVLWGARVSLSVGFLAALLSITLGTAWGAAAGWIGGRTDAVLMRVVDALLALPRLLLLIVIAALWGQLSLPVLVLVLGCTGWYGTSRLVRDEVRALRTRDFVTGARALGVPGLRILVRHVLPNALSPVVVAATLAVGNVIAVEAGLSFLGIGVRPPQASWGSIIADGASDIGTLWWIAFFPGLAIVCTVLACNALGDGLRDALDPREVSQR